MKITVTPNGGEPIRLRFATGLMINGISATVISGQLGKVGLEISGKQLRHLFRAMKQYRAQHPGWRLVEVESQNGDLVQIEV